MRAGAHSQSRCGGEFAPDLELRAVAPLSEAEQLAELMALATGDFDLVRPAGGPVNLR